MSILIVIPTLNEAAHIERLLGELLPFAQMRAAVIVVADGGSSDGTQAIVQQVADRHREVRLTQNPDRLQSAGINHAVRLFGTDREWLIRIDAHSSYPADYCQTLCDEAAATGADSVVVAMEAVGETPLQAIIAAAQNARFGNGGAAHRMGSSGRWVDHGHHALMRLAAFRLVGGYDPSFSHNEDAELDHRLRAAGFRIWLTAATRVAYFPRRSLGALLRQYYQFGNGRARNLRKHRQPPALRQTAVAALLPALLLALAAPLSPLLLLPAVIWIAACLAGGASLAFGRDRNLMRMPGMARRLASGLLAGFFAGLMHVAWSTGFWVQVLTGQGPQPQVCDA